MTDSTSNQTAEKPHRPLRTRIIIGGTVVVLGAGLTGYFVRNHYYPGTNDAYVHAYTITISPYVEGYIKNVHASPNEFVKKGQLIYEITPLPFELKVAQQEHLLTAAIAKKASLKQALLQSKQRLKDQQASQWIIDLNEKRYAYLQQEQVVALAKAQEFQASKLEALAKTKAATIDISQIEKDILQQQAIIDALRAEIGQAKVNLGYTRYYAPIDAYVSNNFSIRTGQYVKPGQALFKLIDNSKWWVDANFKESQIHRIRMGMPANISLDMYPNKSFKGNVINISRGSGAYESLLPPENATGNWVKVPQRFPVRILMEQNDQYPLRAGATAHARVNTVKP